MTVKNNFSFELILKKCGYFLDSLYYPGDCWMNSGTIFAVIRKEFNQLISKNLLKQPGSVAALIFLYHAYWCRIISQTLPCFISSTTPGSNKVLMSPRLSVSPSAIFLNILLMILPLLGLGKPVTN